MIFYNIICISNMFTWPHQHTRNINTETSRCIYGHVKKNTTDKNYIVKNLIDYISSRTT